MPVIWIEDSFMSNVERRGAKRLAMEFGYIIVFERGEILGCGHFDNPELAARTMREQVEEARKNGASNPRGFVVVANVAGMGMQL